MSSRGGTSSVVELFGELDLAVAMSSSIVVFRLMALLDARQDPG